MTDHGCGVQRTVRPTRASGHGVRDHATGLSNPPCVLRRARYPEAGVRQGADPSSAFLRGNGEGARSRGRSECSAPVAAPVFLA